MLAELTPGGVLPLLMATLAMALSRFYRPLLVVTLSLRDGCSGARRSV